MFRRMLKKLFCYIYETYLSRCMVQVDANIEFTREFLPSNYEGDDLLKNNLPKI